MKIRWLMLIVIIILAVCIVPAWVSSSGTSSNMAFAAGTMNIPQVMPNVLTVAEATPEPTFISLNPDSFIFSGAQNGTNPPDRILKVSKSGAGNLIWSLSNSSAWLTLSKSGGINAGSFALSVNIYALKSGTYTDNITITASGADNSPLQVPVVLNISAAAS
ncbi:MAG: BACON domain-containing protein, partial [Dehalococcoidia bacterium]